MWAAVFVGVPLVYYCSVSRNSEILSGIPFYSTVLVSELVTPLGAALMATLGSQFGSLPSGFHSKMIAYGAGKGDLAIV